MQKRILGVDLGDARTGLAVSDASRFLASGIGYVSPGGIQKTADKVAEIIRNAGTNLVGVKVISLGGFLMFGGTLSAELQAELVAWVEEMVAAGV